MKTVFITGTDTNIGKTYVSTILLRAFKAKGYQTFGIKPIASGCKPNKDGIFENEDALELMSNSTTSIDYHTVNPIALAEPIAPHIALQMTNTSLTAKQLSEHIVSSIQTSVDINIIEGVGGWHVPLNNHELISDSVSLLKIPVILVVGIRLGCLNHAILTSSQIKQTRAPLIGWFANVIDPHTQALEENIETLKQWIKAPLFGIVPYQSKPNVELELIWKQLHHHAHLS